MEEDVFSWLGVHCLAEASTGTVGSAADEQREERQQPGQPARQRRPSRARAARRTCVTWRPLAQPLGATIGRHPGLTLPSGAPMHSDLANPASLIARVEPLTRTRAVRGPFDYRLRPEQADVGVGAVLRVPFGRQKTLGVVLELAAESELALDRLAEPDAVLPPGVPGGSTSPSARAPRTQGGAGWRWSPR